MIQEEEWRERERERDGRGRREIPSWIKVIQNIILHGQFEFWKVMAHPSGGERKHRL